MHLPLCLVVLLFTFFSCKPEPADKPDPPDPIDTNTVQIDFITGMDLSYQPVLGEAGTSFTAEDGSQIPNMMEYVKSQGVNLVRFRLFHSPDPNDPILAASSFNEVLELSRKVKASDNQLLLDIHYSDRWADPGKQFLPAAWEGLSQEILEDSVYAYTRFVLDKLAEVNALPDMVQIGNETNSGFLWDQGRVWGAFSNNWGNYASLIKAGARAIKEIETLYQKEIYSIIHVAGPRDKKAFFQALGLEAVDFDIIGLSYYSRFHSQNLTEIQSALDDLALTFKKPILIVETAYPWTLDWDDWTNNLVGLEEHLINGYPATPAGQLAFFEDFVEILKAVPENRGVGFVWWAPDFVAFDGPQSTKGSPWENMTTFDFSHQALPVMSIFRDY